MRKKEEVQSEDPEQVVQSKVACINCDDSGKECYVCGAGRQLVE